MAHSTISDRHGDPALFLCAVRHAATRQGAKRLASLAQLTRVNPQQEAEWEVAVKNVFDVFDQDGTGDMDAGELRQLLKLLYPGAQSLHYRKVMMQLREFADIDGHLEVDTFQDALVMADEYAVPTSPDPDPNPARR